MMMSQSTMSGRTSGEALEREPAVADGDDVEVLVREGQLDDLLDRDAVVREQDLLAHARLCPRGRAAASRSRCAALPRVAGSRRRCVSRAKIDPSPSRVNGFSGDRAARAARQRRRPTRWRRITSWVEAPGRKTSGDPELLQLGDVLGGDDAADEHLHVVHAPLAQQLDHPPADRHVGAGEDRRGRSRRRPPARRRPRSAPGSGAGRCRSPPCRRRAGPGRSTLAPRSCPSSPGLATRTRILRARPCGLAARRRHA